MFSLSVAQAKCNGCTLCEKVCPAEAVTVHDKQAHIDSAHCLQCAACQTKCPKDAISYRRQRRESVKQAVS